MSLNAIRRDALIKTSEPEGRGCDGLGGVSVDMAGTQRMILSSAHEQIRPVAESVARSLWQTRQASSLDPLMALLTTASANYTAQLTQAAISITQSLGAASRWQVPGRVPRALQRHKPSHGAADFLSNDSTHNCASELHNQQY